MECPPSRILLAIEPRFLEGALATVLTACLADEVVEVRQGCAQVAPGAYDAAVVSTELPENVHAQLLIMLPDTRGGAGTGTVRIGDVEHEVSISDAQHVVQLIEQYLPQTARPRP